MAASMPHSYVHGKGKKFGAFSHNYPAHRKKEKNNGGWQKIKGEIGSRESERSNVNY